MHNDTDTRTKEQTGLGTSLEVGIGDFAASTKIVGPVKKTS